MLPHSLLVASALILIALAIPLWLRRVPPNAFYGVRTRATLADEGAWYDVNARSGRDLFVSAVIFLASIFAIDAIGARWAPELRTALAALVLVVALIVVTLRAMRDAGRA